MVFDCNLSPRTSPVGTAFVQAAGELWLHRQVNAAGFRCGRTLRWLFCHPGGGSIDPPSSFFWALLALCNVSFSRWFQEDNYVLPMLWLGLSVRMLCPQVRRCSSSPPTVTCYAEGMVVKLEWPLSETYVKGGFY